MVMGGMDLDRLRAILTPAGRLRFATGYNAYSTKCC